MKITHTVLDEVREALGHLISNEAISDAEINRIIYKNMSQGSSTYSFQKFDVGLWKCTLPRQYYMLYNPTFTSVGEAIYEVNCDGSIYCSDTYFRPLVSIDNSPDYIFEISGNYASHFGSGDIITIRGTLDQYGARIATLNDGEYTVDSAINSGGYTYITVNEPITSLTVGGELLFNCDKTLDTRTNISVKAVWVQFNEVMAQILYYISTSYSQERLQQLMGSGTVITMTAADYISVQAQRWRGTWSIK
jgi:hypothetical protein